MGLDLTAASALLSALDAEPHAALLLDDHGRIAHVNGAWNRQALEHRQTRLTREHIVGTPYLSWLKGPLRIRAAEALERLAHLPELEGTTLDGECNTPQVHQRLTSHFSRLVAPLEGVLVRFFLRVEGPLARHHELTERTMESFVDARGLVTQCSCCRRARDPQTGQWHLSLALFAAPAGVEISHGLCETCSEAYYPHDEVVSP